MEKERDRYDINCAIIISKGPEVKSGLFLLVKLYFEKLRNNAFKIVS